MHRVAASLIVLGVLASCGALPSTRHNSRIRVVAAENTWGALAAGLGGGLVDVISIVSNPDADPHDYEPTAGDARLLASADYVIYNGAGYDSWVPKLLAANPVAGRARLDVAAFLGRHPGENPHLWYSPEFVAQVVAKIASDLGALRPSLAGDLDAREIDYLDSGLAPYHQAIAAIRQHHAEARVGATESIFTYLASSLGLDLVSPSGYMQATSEGAEPTAADRASFRRLIATRGIALLVVNRQNSTPESEALVSLAKSGGIPIAEVTETMPASATFASWQTDQLTRILQALGG